MVPSYINILQSDLCSLWYESFVNQRNQKAFCQQSKKKLNNVENTGSISLVCLFLCMSGLFLFLFYITKYFMPIQFSHTCPCQSACASINFCLCLCFMSCLLIFIGCIIDLFVALLLVHLSAILTACLLTD